MGKNLADSAWVQLNIGGTVFETTRQTLCRDPESFLARLVSDDSILPRRKDKNGAYVIDRDPDNFACILRYLRTGILKAPDGAALDELVEEAEFYNLPALVKLLEDAKSKVPHIEMFTLERHPDNGFNRVLLVSSELEKGSDIFTDIRSKGVRICEGNGHYYMYETPKFDRSSTSHTWAEIYTKVWPVLLTNGFKLEKEEPNRWTFVRTVEK